MHETFLIISIGIGVILNMLSLETLGLAAGGMVVPGYLALNLHKTGHIVTTFFVALAVFFLVRVLSNFMLIYGRRLLMFSIFWGFVLGRMTELFVGPLLFPTQTVEVIGYIVPGLMAYWMERQGVIRTTAVTVIGAVLTWLFMIIISGGKIPL